MQSFTFDKVAQDTALRSGLPEDTVRTVLSHLLVYEPFARFVLLEGQYKVKTQEDGLIPLPLGETL